LHDLANELQVQVVSCNSDGLRYAFILDRGELGRLPTHVDFPFIENGKLLVRVVYSDSPPSRPTPPVDAAIVDDHRLVRQGVGAFLKVFDDIKLRDDAALQLSAQNLPDIVVIDEAEFNKRVAEHEANQQRVNQVVIRWYYERKDNETEFALYRYGFAYLTGLSDRICARQTTPVFKFKRKHPSGKFISYCSSPARHMTERKIMNMRKKGNDAYSND
jgi:hypothetical protein